MLTDLTAGSALRPRRFDAVVIGASAGGVEAVGILLAALPKSLGATVIVVIHVPPVNENLLVRVLAPRCALPLSEACDKEAVEEGKVYLAPPGYHLLVERERTFALSVDEPVQFSRPSLDVLFESAAYAYRERLLAIVLTGANSDGADGLSVVRELGGTAWVQDPSTAYASAMPEAAIERAGADRITTLNEMAQSLAELASERERTP